ncbi:MAG TPA: AsmA family protein, partial [Saliniramus sp.]|nr:AsmA family protein [Saliniramus sp.]
MRDILTALAFLVILVLSAALVVPPFIDWEGRRGDLEAAMSRAAGVPIEIRGEIDLRLLPSPRLRVDGLTLGVPDGDALSLVAQEVLAELELTGLLRGEVRFQSVAIRRANLRVPSDSGTVRLPDALTAPEDALGAWALDDLRVSTLDVTTISTDLGTRHLTDLQDVVVTAQNLAGPWRVDGLIDGRPFRLATGRLDPDGRMQLKLVGGGDAPVRYDVDAILALEPEGDRFRTNLSGTARIVATPPSGADGETPQSVILETGFVRERMGVSLSELGIEFGDPSLGSRLEGAGFLRLDDPRLGLQLEGRRLAADAILAGPVGQFLREQLG